MPEGFKSGNDMPGAAAVPDVPEVTTSEAFKQNCTDLTGLCIIAALSHEADDFAAHKATFQVASKAQPSCCLWSDSSSNVYTV